MLTPKNRCGFELWRSKLRLLPDYPRARVSRCSDSLSTKAPEEAIIIVSQHLCHIPSIIMYSDMYRIFTTLRLGRSHGIHPEQHTLWILSSLRRGHAIRTEQLCGAFCPGGQLTSLNYRMTLDLNRVLTARDVLSEY